jgi:hypothetical protein
MASPATVLQFPPEPPSDDLLTEILRRRTERLAGQAKAYARTIPIASDVDPDSCARRQVLEIVAWQDKPVPEADRQARFEAGSRAEEDIIIDLKRDGFRVVHEQLPFELKHRRTGEPCLRGKIDGKVEWKGKPVPFEIKSAHPNIYGSINSTADWDRWWWTRKYPSQLQSYLVGHGHEWGFWILTDCLGNWKPLRADLDYALAERIWAFAESVLDGVRAYRADGTLPGYTADPTQCAHCDFFGRTCNPDTIEQGAAMLSDPELEAQIARWCELREPHREYDGLDKRVKSALKTALPAQPTARGIVGRFAVTITDRPVKAEAKPRPARVDRIVEIEELKSGSGETQP